MIRKHLVLILTFILVICALGCSKTRDAEVLFPVTEVGTPDGPKVTKEIGPAGGSLASSDGRLTLTVPPNALAETVAFHIQPVTNKVNGGLRSAYRLEPAGKTFTTPLQISVRYDEHDLEGTIADAFSLAYQDGQRAWRVQKSAKLDKDKQTLTVLTSHFSDWSFLTRVKLSPAKATLFVGESQAITLVLCEEQGFIDRLLSRPANCQTLSSKGAEWRVQGAGTIQETGSGVIYTAPPKKPLPNRAFVIMSIELEDWEPSGPFKVKWELGTEITIVDRGYKVSAGTAGLVYSGVICSLEKPFTVKGTNPAITYVWEFIPSSPTSGTVSHTGGGNMVKAVGGGSYIINGADSSTPRIVLTETHTGSSPVGGKTVSSTLNIDLLQLDTGACNPQ